jgi:catechol 2,3-dioxygenase-like lactoylglutathione lyase family enzyme
MTRDPLFERVLNVAIPVTNQDRTKELFEALGFSLVMDAELSEGFRWVELCLPDAATRIALVAADSALPKGIDTGIRLITSDAAAARTELLELGLSADELLAWDGIPLMFSFCDFDGNRFYVTESS